MIKTAIRLQDLRRRIYRKAKADKMYRFWGIFVHIAKMETLEQAYRQAKRNGGVPGVDGQRFEDIEACGREKFLMDLRDELTIGTYNLWQIVG